MSKHGWQIGRRQVLAGSAGATAAMFLPALSGCRSNAPLPPLTLDGRVVTPDAPEFEDWRKGVIWQSRKPDRSPALIVRPNSTAAVADAVNYARANGLKLAVKSSGHNLWGNFLRDGGMLLDMWNFRKVEMDSDGESAWIEPSVWSRDIMLELGRHGRAFPAAHCASVGMGGFLLGGGVGLNWANWGGLSAHSVIGAEVVTADGGLRTIDDSNDPDLAWALRGTGNGFPAVVTRFKVKTYPAPALLKAGTYIFPAKQSAEAMAWVEDMASRGMLVDCEPLVILAHSPFATPDAPPEQAKVCVVRFNLFASDAAKAASQLQAIAKEAMAAKSVMSIPDQDWTFEENYVETLSFRVSRNFGYFGVDTIWTDAPEKALPELSRHFLDAPTTATHVVMSILPGAKHPANAAARVHGKLFVGLYAVGSTAEEGEQAIEWLRRTADALAPLAKGRYINEIDPESDSTKVASCFSEADWKKIGEVRRKYDPDGLFHDYFGLEG